MSLTRAHLDIPPSGGLVTVSNSLTTAKFDVGNLGLVVRDAGGGAR
jgi:hypothetical protein